MNNLHDTSHKRKSVYANMIVNGYTVRFQIDTGATTNPMPRKYIPEETIIVTDSTLTMWNGAESSPAGTAILNIKNPKSGSVHQLDIVVVDADLPPILGMEAVTDLDLVQINYDNFVFASVCAPRTFIDNYTSVFDGGLGRLPGTVTLSITKVVRPRVLPTRRIPVAMRSLYIKELDHLLDLGVIAKVDWPSDLVSQIAIVLKKSGELRI